MQGQRTWQRRKAASAKTGEYDDESVAHVKITMDCENVMVTGNLAQTGANLDLLGVAIAFLGAGAIFTVAQVRRKSHV